MISSTSEYALRALVQLAHLKGDELMRGRDLSDMLRIPANYLSKVLLTLRNAGIVEATRGFGGGYRLCKLPYEVRLIDVVELFEGVYSRPHCFLGEDRVCSDRTPCAAHEAFRDVRAAYIRFLEKTTLATLARKDAELRGKRKSVSQS